MDTSTVVMIVLMLTVPIGVFVVIWLVMHRVGRGAEDRADDLRAEVEKLGEEWVVPLAPGAFAGALHTFSKTRANGVVGLTSRRVLFQPIVGERLSIPLAHVSRVDAGRLPRGQVSGGKRNLVLLLDDGNEIGFFVQDTQAWVEALAARGVKRLGMDDEQPSTRGQTGPVG